MKKFSFFTLLSVLFSFSVFGQAADLELEMTVDPYVAGIGQTVVFSINVTNIGSDDAPRVTVRDYLPTGYEFISAIPTQGAYESISGTWNIGTLTGGNSAGLQLNAKITNASDLINLAEVMTSGILDRDSTPGNGVDTDRDGIVTDDPGDEDDGDGQEVVVGGDPSSGDPGNCLAPLDAQSSFSANPIDPVNSVFRFDYKIEAVLNFEMNAQDFNEEYSRGDPMEWVMDYYVNSADGSILLPGGSMGFFKTNFSYSNDFGKIDAAVWLPNGQMVVYGFDAKENLDRAVTRESIQSAEGRQGMDYFNMMQFFDSSQELAESADIPPADVLLKYGTVAGYKGKYAESFTGLENTWNLYFDTNPTPIKTSCIMMGFMVGVLKDARASKCNRLLVYSKVNIGGEDSGESMEARLISVKPVRRTFDATSYLPMTIDGDTGTQAQVDLSSYESRMRDLQVSREFLKREREQCRDRACFDRVDASLEENRMARSRLTCESMVAMGMETSVADCMAKEE